MSNQNAETNQDLVVIDQQNVLVAFQEPEGLDPVIEQIRQKVKSEVYDISTKEGRDRIGSVARQIGSAKRRLKEMSQGLTSDWQAKTKIVTTEATRMEKELNDLRDEVKAPLDAYNDKEKLRIADHENNLSIIEAARDFEFEPTIQQIAERLENLKKFEDIEFEEFVDKKNASLAYSEKVLNEKLAALKEQKVKDEELAELKKEKEEREQKERDDKIAEDAAAKATKDAEEKAEADKVKAEEEAEAEKVKAKEKSDAEAKRLQDIADKAEQDKEDAQKLADESAENERKKIADEEQADIDAAHKREEDKAHNKKINKEILLAFYEEMSLDEIEDSLLKQVLNLIRQGKIPHVKISY